MSDRRSRTHQKEHRTPEAVGHFVDQFRRDALRDLHGTWLAKGHEAERTLGVHFNADRLKRFLLKQIEPPVPDLSEFMEEDRDTERPPPCLPGEETS